MPDNPLAIRRAMVGLKRTGRRHLLGLVQHIRQERSGRIAANGVVVPAHPRLDRAIVRATRALGRRDRVDVVEYAAYLKQCQRARIQPTPARRKLSWWSPTPRGIVIEALKLAEVGPRDVVFDLGCGDGRVVVDAARLFGARAIGCDIDPKRIREARARIRRAGVAPRARARRQSMLAIPDLYRASVLYLYLPQRTLNRLVPLLARRCRPGTRIVTVDTWNRKWPATKALTVGAWPYKWRIGLWHT
jgi:SAM-dependent methyltransferase